MLSWLSKQIITRMMAQTRAGNIEPTLRLDADDVRFVFPGDNSWSGEIRGKQELRRWLERLVRVGIKTFPDEVVAAGPPWRTTVCFRGRDHLTGPEGERVYENRFVIWGKLRWGKLYDYEVYEDTQKAKALDEWLAEHEHALAR
jgi:ketosteroid isomerase-like protein